MKEEIEVQFFDESSIVNHLQGAEEALGKLGHWTESSESEPSDNRLSIENIMQLLDIAFDAIVDAFHNGFISNERTEELLRRYGTATKELERWIESALKKEKPKAQA